MDNFHFPLEGRIFYKISPTLSRTFDFSHHAQVSDQQLQAALWYACTVSVLEKFSSMVCFLLLFLSTTHILHVMSFTW